MERRNDIDWLRVGATYLLFVFHVGMVFSPAPFYHVRNVDVSFVVLVVCGFISLWHMPLFFLLAGWSAVASLRLRGGTGFVRERLLRLGLPLVAGCVLLAPMVKYLELRSGLDLNYAGLWVAERWQESFKLVIPGGLPLAPPFDEGFLEFLPSFFTRLERFSWGHLWFVAYLLTFTLLYRPILGWLVARRWSATRPATWWVYAPLVPLVLVQVTLRPYWPGIQNLFDDWANVAYYSTYFLVGTLLAAAPSFEALVQREWKRALGVAGLAASGLLVALLTGFQSESVLLAGSAIAGWCFVVAALGLAHRFLSFRSARLDYLSESAFPVYLLHQSAIVILGYGVVALPLGIAAKLVLLFVLSVAATLLVYHVLVRPFALPRLLTGMKPKACPLRSRPALRPRVAALLLAVGMLGVSPVSASTPEGLWYAEGGAAKVRVARCGTAFCGRVEWLRSPFDEHGCELQDFRNPDVRLRARPVAGLEILRGLERSPEQPDAWVGGTIYDPGSGSTYSCRVAVEGDLLRLRGYLGVPLLGRTTTWVRVGAETRTCRATATPSAP